MELLNLTISITVFFFVASLVALIYLAWGGRFAERLSLRKRLLYLSAGGNHGRARLATDRQPLLKNATPLDRFTLALPRLDRLDRRLIKSDLPLNAASFIAVSLCLGGASALAGLWLLPRPALAIPAGLLGAFIPWLLLAAAERRSDRRFGEQLPAALDLMARALRSGHALSAAMEMVAEESEEPLSGEFRAAVDEMKLGLSLADALGNMCGRVTCLDLRFFTVSVVIQRETGGNLAEILDRIGSLIRERMQFHKQVQALTAEGRLSGNILIALPVTMFLYIYFVNYDYVSLLWTDRLGVALLCGGLVMQAGGYLLIRRLVRIDI